MTIQESIDIFHINGDDHSFFTSFLFSHFMEIMQFFQFICSNGTVQAARENASSNKARKNCNFYMLVYACLHQSNNFSWYFFCSSRHLEILLRMASQSLYICDWINHIERKKKAALFLSDFMGDRDGRQNVLETVMQLQGLGYKVGWKTCNG